MSENNGNGTLMCVFCTPGAEGTDIRICFNQTCGRAFCPEHSSKISPNCCKDCFQQLAVVIDKYTKIDEEYSEKNDCVISHKHSCKRIRLDGPDFVWYSIAISRLTDEELEHVLQFHRYMVSLLESTTTIRTVKKSNALAGFKMPRLATSTTTEIKKTRKVKQTKSLREILIESGITDEGILTKMIAASGSGGTV